MTGIARHQFEPGPDPLTCRHCGYPRYTSAKGTDPNHKRDPKGTSYGRATK